MVNVVTIAAYRRIYWLRLIGLVQRSAATWRCVLHSSDEPGELWQWQRTATMTTPWTLSWLLLLLLLLLSSEAVFSWQKVYYYYLVGSPWRWRSCRAGRDGKGCWSWCLPADSGRSAPKSSARQRCNRSPRYLSCKMHHDVRNMILKQRHTSGFCLTLLFTWS